MKKKNTSNPDLLSRRRAAAMGNIWLLCKLQEDNIDKVKISLVEFDDYVFSSNRLFEFDKVFVPPRDIKNPSLSFFSPQIRIRISSTAYFPHQPTHERPTNSCAVFCWIQTTSGSQKSLRGTELNTNPTHAFKCTCLSCLFNSSDLRRSALNLVEKPYSKLTLHADITSWKGKNRGGRVWVSSGKNCWK